MPVFSLYFELGFDHILDLNGYDHILFIVALCALYRIEEFKKLVILITAFTLGHSVTLGLATLNLISFNRSLIEFLIPCTILITAVNNIMVKGKPIRRSHIVNYAFALFFGLIHGMGFAGYLKNLLSKNDSILTPLFAFNLGLELGQIIIIGLIMFLSFIFVRIFRASQRDWRLVTSSAVAGISAMMMIETKFW